MIMPESHTDAELSKKFPHHKANPEVANSFEMETYYFMLRESKGRCWNSLVFPVDFMHFHRWN